MPLADPAREIARDGDDGSLFHDSFLPMMVCRHFRIVCAAGERPGPAHSPLRSRSKGGSRTCLALPREQASVMRQFGDEQAKRKKPPIIGDPECNLEV